MPSGQWIDEESGSMKNLIGVICEDLVGKGVSNMLGKSHKTTFEFDGL
jgi:hypothetical protein